MKHSMNPAIALLISITMVTTASAQPGNPIVKAPVTTKPLRITKLPPGVNEAQLRQRLTSTLAARRARISARVAKFKADDAKIQAAMSADHAKVATALKKDPQYIAFVDEARRINSSKRTTAQKAEILRALTTRNRTIYTNAMKGAGIDRATLQSKLNTITPGTTVSSELLVRRIVTTAPSDVTLQPGPVFKAPQTIVLQPPFSIEEEESDNGGLAVVFADAIAKGEDGEAHTDVVTAGILGGGSAKATVGELVQVPAGYSRMEVVVKAELKYEGTGIAVVAVAATSCHAVISVSNTGSDANSQSAEFEIYELGVAPVAWYFGINSSETKEYKFSFNVPDADREYLISASSDVTAAGGGVGGYADGEATADIKKITITFTQ